ncbi:MAG: IS1380 family transposase [Candidatus Margulisiibacteriota bacterium]
MILKKELGSVTLEKSDENVTGKIGLTFVYHSMKHFGLHELIKDIFPKAKQRSNREESPEKKILSSALSFIAGGERIEDIEVLRADKALIGSLGWASMISADTVRNFLMVNRNGAYLRQLNEAGNHRALQRFSEKKLTYDNDATYFDSDKDSAEWSYKKERQFSGLLGFWTELGICNTVDFRPGNISPATGVLNQLRKAAQQAEKADKQLSRFRSNSAGYQYDIFKYCEDHGIRYFISGRKTLTVKEIIADTNGAGWQKVPQDISLDKEKRDMEWAETIHVMNDLSMRMMVLRWKNLKANLFEQDEYCYHAIVTNDCDIEPMAWLKFHNGRMSSENFNKELKNGFHNDYAPSHSFVMNRNYFLIGVLAYNIMQWWKLFYLGPEAIRWNIKRLRLWFLNTCGKLISHGRQVICRILNSTDGTFGLFRYCMGRLVVV